MRFYRKFLTRQKTIKRDFQPTRGANVKVYFFLPANTRFFQFNPMRSIYSPVRLLVISGKPFRLLNKNIMLHPLVNLFLKNCTSGWTSSGDLDRGKISAAGRRMCSRVISSSWRKWPFFIRHETTKQRPGGRKTTRGHYAGCAHLHFSSPRSKLKPKYDSGNNR